MRRLVVHKSFEAYMEERKCNASFQVGTETVSDESVKCRCSGVDHVQEKHY